jgi:hypothetical protein
LARHAWRFILDRHAIRLSNPHALVLLAAPAFAQQTRYYDNRGNSLGTTAAAGRPVTMTVAAISRWS